MSISGGRVLQDWAQALSDAADRAAAHRANEEELRLDLNPVISAASLELHGLNALSATAERRGHRGTQRTYDNLYGGVVVEWEWSMGNARREHGAQQALEYLADLRTAVGNDRVFTAVVSDGRQWGFLVVDPQDQSSLFDDVPTTAAGHFEWHVNDAAACRRFLELLGSHRQQPITAARLSSVFGPNNQATRDLVILLVEALAGRSQRDRADSLYQEWRRALDVVYGDLDATEGDLVSEIGSTYGVRIDRPVGEYLFVLHTYFSLLARLFAMEILSIATHDDRFRPTRWTAEPTDVLIEELAGIDRGELPGGLTIDNLFESDIFGWWLESARGNVDLMESIRTQLSAMSDLAFPRTVLGPQQATDVLADLYQSLVPRQLRKKLGEFLTPQWLALASLERMRSVGAQLQNGRVLDPTCGTGTFIVPVLAERLSILRRTSQNLTATDVQAVLNQVVGIDINPVAVTATRVNYVLALGSLAGLGNLTLPVWRADSLLVPDAPPRQGSSADGRLQGFAFRELRTSLEMPFRLPPDLASAEGMDRLRRALQAALDEESDAQAEADLLAALGLSGGDLEGALPEDPATNDAVVSVQLLRDIRELKRQNRDGIWAQIIANAFAPLFAGKFDVVVGNPPWLAWGKLPLSWRSGSERLWQKYGLWRLPVEPGDTGGVFQVSDIAQLVYAVALERYAASGGFVGLLTPRALLNANPGGRAFRRQRLESDADFDGDQVSIPFRMRFVDDWSAIQPFAPLAANMPVFIISQRDAAADFPVPAARWSRAANGRRSSWREMRTLLHEQPGSLTPSNPMAPTSALAFIVAGAPPMLTGGVNGWSFGVGLHTRGANGIYFVNVLRSIGAQGLVEIENDPSAGRLRDVRGRRGIVEAAVVYPLLRGRDVSPWMAAPSQFVVVPHRSDDFGRVMSASDLSSNGPFARVGAWLRTFRPLLTERRPPPNRNWHMAGDDWCRIEGPLEHMRGDHVVVVREMSGRPAAALVEPVFIPELQRSDTPLVEHKLLFCSVPTHEEALYLVAFLNSTPAQDFLASFASATGVTPRALRTVPIPPFQPMNPQARELVAAAEAVQQESGSNRVEKAAQMQARMDEAVVILGRMDPATYQQQPSRRPRRRSTASGIEPLF